MPRPIEPAREGALSRLWLRVAGRLPITHKLSLAISFLMVACIGMLSVLIVQNQTRILRTQIDRLGTTVAAQMARSVAEPILADDKLALGVLATNLAADENVLGTAVLDAEGRVLATAGILPQQLDSMPLEQLNRLEWTPEAGTLNTRNLILYSQPVRVRDLVAGHVLVALNGTEWEAAARHALGSIAGVSLVVLLIGGALTVWMSRRLSRPIYELIDASEALHDGRYDVRFPEHRTDELGNLMARFNRFAEELARKHHAERTLQRYLSPRLAETLLTGSPTELGGQRVEASVLFADIVGFTGMAEDMSPEAIAELLNRYFAHFVRASELTHGLVDKYIGDCVMLVFGVPQSDPEHAFHAVTCALAIQRLVARENAERESRGLTPVRFRLGLNAGQMLAGNMGSQERMEYTVLGDSVNLASRLSAAAGGGQVLVTEAFYRRPEIRDRVVAHKHRAIRPKGISRPVDTYVITDLAPPYREPFERQVEQIWWRGLRRSA